jgi:predicted nucleic acid-binding protein
VIIVVDTNIVFSGLLNPTGKIGDLLLNSVGVFEFYAPAFILEELINHHQKLLKISNLHNDELIFLKRILLKKIELIDLDTISGKTWDKSIELVQNIDEFDAPFIALSIELSAPLWTGDKKLINGLKKKNVEWILSTDLVSKIRNKE